MKVHDDPLETFREEARELLAELERALMQLEDDPADTDSVDSAFRSLHTIKGSGNMFDLDQLVSFAHTVESVFARVRDGEAPVSPELVELGLQAKDHIGALLATGDAAAEGLLEEGAELERRLLAAGGAAATEPAEGPATTAAAATPAGLVAEAEERTYRVTFVPGEDLYRTGTNPLLLIKELAELGSALVMGFTDRVPSLGSMDPEACYISWDIVLTSRAGENAIRDVFIFVEGNSEVRVQLIDEGSVLDTDISYKRLGEILVERGDIAPGDLEQAMGSRDYLGETLVQRGYITPERVESALQEQQYVRRMREQRQVTETTSSIKVSTEKLDSLVNLVGEFVSMHANLTHRAESREDREFIAMGEQMEALVRDLRDLSIDMHMVPVDILFSGFRRLVRDLAQDLGKEVALQIEGSETELDKNVIDSLKDPLLHIIRNSIDHGLETPEERRAAGKDSRGTVRLAAYYAGTNVVIEVADDGKGIDAEKVRAKAAERGIIAADADLSEEQMLDLIFSPGFSTAAAATNVSGRGVGMDVVKQNIEKLGGTVRVESRPAKGTRMSLRIPLTLAIVEGLLARIAGGYYLINIAYIVECIDMQAMKRNADQRIIDFRGEILPYFDLRRFFGFAPADLEQSQLVVVSNDDRKIGLLVDSIHDNYQTVIKSLSKVFERVEGISGAVTLGDGTPALMLDVDRLVRVGAEEVKE
ncbi:MAG: chemotaxis protein CheA [Spirochaetes bacterium]|jgi:two-component system chemotaxis sensor kinase CheA|nr:chemotaxis protein CheA [Spirochaetota bacterium]